MFVLLALLATNTVSASPLVNPLEIEIVHDWQDFKVIDGIKIEYKFQAFESGAFRNQVLVVFRYTNTSSEKKSMTWTIEEYRDGTCFNCERLNDPEYSRTITLSPGEVFEKKIQNKNDLADFLIL